MPGSYRINGVLFYRDKEGGPALAGNIEIDGTKYHISCWPKQSRNGTDYMQISEDKKPDKPSGGSNFGNKFRRPSPPVASSTKKNDMDDDIPF